MICRSWTILLIVDKALFRGAGRVFVQPAVPLP